VVLLSAAGAAASALVDASLSGALVSLIHAEGGIGPEKVELVYSAVKGATASGDADVSPARLRRMHMKITSKARKKTKPPRTPPTMAAMGGPLWVAVVAWLGDPEEGGGGEEELWD